MPLPWHVLLHSWGQSSSRRRYYPAELPKPVLTRRLTWKVSIHLFIRFGSQLALSFVVSASLKTWFCLFMVFLSSEKKFGRFHPSFKRNFSEPSSPKYTHTSKPASLGFYFQGKTDNHFCIQQDTASVEIIGLSHKFLFPLFFLPLKFASRYTVNCIEIADVYSNLCWTWWKQLGLLFFLCQNH